MIYLVQESIKDQIPLILENMHKKRREVFVDQLGWPLDVRDKQEIDQFDLPQSQYVLSLSKKFGVIGGYRLLPSTGPTMVRDVFEDHVFDKSLIPNSPTCWEITRLFFKKPKEKGDGIGLIRRGTLELFISMLEFGLSQGIKTFLVDVDVRLESLYNAAGWPVTRISKAREFNEKHYVIGLLNVSQDILDVVRRRSRLYQPVLMTHVHANQSGHHVKEDVLLNHLQIDSKIISSD